MPGEPVYRITLVRHCESVGNAEARLQGHVDYPLSGRGRAQAVALAQRLRSESIAFDHVIASPLLRAQETARIIAAALGIAQLETDPLWIEQDAGTRSGRHQDALRRQPSGTGLVDPGASPAATGENDDALYLRGREALRSILERPPARYLAVSHRAILDMVLHAILGIVPEARLPPGALFRLRNGSFSRLRFFPLENRWQADVIGDRSHWTSDR